MQVESRSQLSGLHQVFLILSMVALVLTGLMPECRARGNDGGKFDGAVWKFTMTSKGRGNKKLQGIFRVSEHILYQKTSPQEAKFTKVIGKNHPKKLKTKIVFTDLRARNKQGMFIGGFKGVVLLEYHRFGHWSGTFINSTGKHWDFKCTRVQE